MPQYHSNMHVFTLRWEAGPTKGTTRIDKWSPYKAAISATVNFAIAAKRQVRGGIKICM